MTSDTKFWKGFAIALVLAGSLIRIRQAAARQSFWNDEAFIVLNVLHHTDAQLIGHLDYDQAAPPVFLWIERLMGVHFGANEFALRAQALFCGITLLAIFAALAWRVLPPGPAVGAIALIALCDKLVQYCVEVKQYSGDAMIAALLIWLAVISRSRCSGRRILIVALVSSVALWFSHTTSIVFGGISLAILVSILRQKDRRDFAVWVAANALFAISLGALYLLSIRHQHTPFLYNFWSQDLPDLKRPLTFPAWLLTHIYEAFDFPYPFAGGWVIVLSVGGVYWLIKYGKGEVAGFCLAPIALTALAAVLQQYPFNGSRLTLFLIPSILLLAGAGGALALDLLPATLKWVWPMAVAPLLIMGVGEQTYRIFVPRFRSHIRPAVQYVQKHRNPGDAVYMTGAGELPARYGSGARHLEILCYWPDPPPPFFMDWAPAATIPYHRFWLVFPFKPGQGKRLTDALLRDAEASADLRDHFVTPHGGAAYLFEKKSNEKPASRP